MISELEVARLVGEIVTALVAVGGGLWFIARKLWHVIAKLDEVSTQQGQTNKHLARINGSIARHEEELINQRELNAYFAGVLGEPKPGGKGDPAP